MAFNLDAIKLDSNLIADGVWREPEPGFRFKVRAIEYPPYKAYLAKLLKPHRSAIRRGSISLEVLDAASKKAAARFLLVDWEPFLVGDPGELVHFSSEKALELFNSHDEFFRIVQQEAEEQANFKADDFVEAVGNLSASSGGDTSGDAGKTS